jgi:hypothetical protein
MSWSYSPQYLGIDNESQRINSVRFLVGDTDSNSQEVQDEEISFALSQNGDNIYASAAFIAGSISSKYSRCVTTEIDSALRVEYSNLSRQYRELGKELSSQALKNSLGIYAGGILVTEMETVDQDTLRVKPNFDKSQFRYYTGYVDYDICY